MHICAHTQSMQELSWQSYLAGLCYSAQAGCNTKAIPKSSTEGPKGPGTLSEQGSTTEELSCNSHHVKQQQRDRNVHNKPETCKPSLSNTSQKHSEGHYGFYTVLFKIAECIDCWQLSDNFNSHPDEWLFRSLYLVWFDSKRIRS